MLSQVG